MSVTRTNTDVSPDDFASFRRDILTVLASGGKYGLAIKRELEAYYGKEVTHGRLYPQLDWLVERDLVTKSELDRRTNLYEISDKGGWALREHYEWQRDHLFSEYSGGDGE